MNKVSQTAIFTGRAAAVSLAVCALGASAAPALDFAPIPLSLAPSVKPNVMIIMDNSQSMDAEMGGKLINGDDVDTRGNTAKRVLRKILESPTADLFNWGLATFGTENNTPGKYNTQAYWLGNANTMVYTNSCVNGVSDIAKPTALGSGFLPCTANPETGNGFNFITYEVSGDEPSVNDVIYTFNDLSFRYVVVSGGNYVWYPSRKTSATSTSWSASDFTGSGTSFNLSRTDTGFGPTPSTYSRVLLKARAWGYLDDITGLGKILEPVKAIAASGHLSALQGHLTYETSNPATLEIKNSALFTPLAGSLSTVRDYFRRGAGNSRPSPISETCQDNYVILATDGNPTAKTNGNPYSDTEVAAGLHKSDVFSQITALRQPNFSIASSGSRDLTNSALEGRQYDIKTFVVGMGVTANASSLTTLDEIAALGGGAKNGKAFLGSNEADLGTAFKAIFDGINTLPRGGSAVGVNSSAYQAGTAIYQAKFKAGNWSGNLLAYPADASGTITLTSPWGSGLGAAAVVAAQDWDSGRKVITAKASTGAGVKFRWPGNAASPSATEIDKPQADALNADGQGALRLRYLRGDASNEEGCAGSCLNFRKRENGPLGDIVNSAPVFVGAPGFGYPNDFESKPYATFAAEKKNRRRVVYVGANDGMLHAFDAGSVDATTRVVDQGTGAELLAFVPSAVYANLSKLSSPAYSHEYFVDGSPTVGDAFYGGDWRTLLVSGLRSGGKGLFALDVTNPGDFAENAAASLVRWEFRDSGDMGHVYGQPLIVKTNNGKWSVIVGNGYGSTNGNSVLYIIDVNDPSNVVKLDTGSGTNNGLSAPTAIDTNGDGIVDLVYAGDLNGRLWKFDLSATTSATWAVGNGGTALFYTRDPAVSTGDSKKPITSAPDVTRHPKGGFLVAFGTGRFIGVGDNLNTDGQSIYAIWDNLSNGTVVQGQLQDQQIVDTTLSNSLSFRLSTHKVGAPDDPTLTDGRDNYIDRSIYFANKRGWFINLPSTRERAVADVTFRSGRLIALSIIPAVACGKAFSWLMEFDAITGNRLDVLTFDINGDNKLSRGVGAAGDYLIFSTFGNAGGNNVTGQGIEGVASGQTTIGKGPNMEDRVFSTSEGELDKRRSGRGLGGDGRAMWREVR